ncbi:MAG: cytochrome-c peroxidase [Cyclobacteriaceae bacterium]
MKLRSDHIVFLTLFLVACTKSSNEKEQILHNNKQQQDTIKVDTGTVLHQKDSVPLKKNISRTEQALLLSNKKYLKTAEKEFIKEALSQFSALPATVHAPLDNPQTEEKIHLGKLLFFDPILSGDKDVSCATCHHPSSGYAEFVEVSIGVNGHGLGSKRAFNHPNDIPLVKRNSQTVLNTAFNGITTNQSRTPEVSPMFWDLRASSLEEQALKPIESLEEMRGRNYTEKQIIPEVVQRVQNIPDYQKLFAKAFEGDASVSAKKISQAIAAFERTLITNNTRFDQYMRGDKQALSQSELEGFNQFISAGCGTCHNGPMFSDFKPHTLGVKDNNKLTYSDKGLDDAYAFRTPSLRNLQYTAPYMHNGTKKTLKQVLEFYEDITFGKVENKLVKKEALDPLLKVVDIPVKDMSLIISFLNTLNSTGFDKEVPQSVPSGLPVGGNI